MGYTPKSHLSTISNSLAYILRQKAKHISKSPLKLCFINYNVSL